jgi:uncharacterized protein (DUF58 family)
VTDPALQLRARSEIEAASFPPLLARAEQLAGAVLLGDHGRRRAGMGDDFWQYRPAQIGDSRRMIDHRRSARGDMQFVREREWQIAQSVMVWVDRGASMQFTSDSNLPTKGDRARLLGLALSILLIRGGERVGLTGTTLPPRRGNNQILRLAQYLSEDTAEDYAPPEHRAMIPYARALFVSDFLGPLDEVKLALTKAADRGVTGIMYQVLDPTEEAFPFKGRYLDRLAARKAELHELCALAGWRFETHHTDHSAQAGLLWLHSAMGASA